MPTTKRIYDAIDSIAPYKRAESFDNTGVMIDAGRDIASALLCMDVTGETVAEAQSRGAGLIISHHPLIFDPLKRISHGDLVYRLIAAGISCISAHTNLDSAQGGVNDCLAGLLGIKNTAVFGDIALESYDKIIVFTPPESAEPVRTAMAAAGAGVLGAYSECAFMSGGTGLFRPGQGANPYIGAQGELERVEETKIEAVCPRASTKAVVAAMLAAHPYETPAFDIFEDRAVQTAHAMGRIGELDAEMEPEAFARFVKERLGSGSVRYTAGERAIKRVAVCGGAGGSFLHKAIAEGAHAYVTADLRYHQSFEAIHAGLTLVDAGHFATETVVLEPLAQRLRELVPGVSFELSASNRDGWRYI